MNETVEKVRKDIPLKVGTPPVSQAVCGYNGSVSLGGEITKWNVDLMCEAVDVSSMSTLGYEEYLGCLVEAQGSYETLLPVGVIGSNLAVSFINDLETIAMDIIITDIANKTDANDVVTWTYTFVSTGEVTGDGVPTQ